MKLDVYFQFVAPKENDDLLKESAVLAHKDGFSWNWNIVRTVLKVIYNHLSRRLAQFPLTNDVGPSLRRLQVLFSYFCIYIDGNPSQPFKIV